MVVQFCFAAGSLAVECTGTGGEVPGNETSETAPPGLGASTVAGK